MTSRAGLGPQIEHWSQLLSKEGWCIIPALIAAETIASLDSDLAVDFAETPFCQGAFYGPCTKRFGRLLVRSAIASKLVEHPLITGIARGILEPWCDTIQLNLTQALALYPGAPPQLPHRDQDMWRGSTGEVEYLVNVMWPFTRYRSENGATLIYPDSHGSKALDPRIPGAPFPVELEPGSALLFLGSTLHGAGGNRSNEVRRGAIVSYCLGWLKPYENQWLAYPPAVAKHFTPELAALVGYQQHRPNLGNFEGQCPSVLLKERVPKRLPAKDALRPDQEQQLAEFIKTQQWPERGRRRATI